ncbi:heparan-alpha-glucosaminide N-acetyltransferase domain-containing protein [Leucobacter luti]|uniref:Uncharacterized protein DUF1624 n=1 Tax=Leucobacter luti TaxID=340320 RepID=A0A4V6MBZ5_9MICO|nr:heparan-alpha-glucosaminide N-acetyltransferase domain-containing protein [Leucobacter luti]MBL3699893.1 DUF1624 domain-containing protein [Leucobacter luti]RZT62789.1 uncharacterized protein DUF1624 [Leucobacter luti]
MRYVGVDLARFLAIAGMMAAHLVTIGGMAADPGSFAYSAAALTDTLTEGIAAPLFAVLGGVSVVFASRRQLRDGRIGAAIGATVVRGALLILIGLILGLIETPVAIVLSYYGTAMLLVAPLVAVRGWILAALAGLLTAVGGPINAAVRTGLTVAGPTGSLTFEDFGADWVIAVRALLLTGEYPALTWCVYLLLGILVGRALTAASARGSLGRAAAVIAGVGAAVAVAAQLFSEMVIRNVAALGGPWVPGTDPAAVRELVAHSSSGAPLAPELWAQLIATPHSGSPVDILRTAGIAALVIGLLVLVSDAGPTARDRRLGPVLGTVRAAGAAPLTIYTLHIVATGLLLEPALQDPQVWITGFPWWAAGVSAFVLQLAGALAIGAILAALGRRGPLEAAVSGVVRVAVGDGRPAGARTARGN